MEVSAGFPSRLLAGTGPSLELPGLGLSDLSSEARLPGPQPGPAPTCAVPARVSRQDRHWPVGRRPSRDTQVADGCMGSCPASRHQGNTSKPRGQPSPLGGGFSRRYRCRPRGGGSDPVHGGWERPIVGNHGKQHGVPQTCRTRVTRGPSSPRPGGVSARELG